MFLFVFVMDLAVFSTCASVPYLEMQDHRQNKCDYRKLSCQECNWEGPFTQFVQHCTEVPTDAVSCHLDDICEAQVIGGSLLDLVEDGEISCCAYTELYRVRDRSACL